MISFDKRRCLNNIYALAKQKNIKIGDLEKEAGLSLGYLSRLAKEDNTSIPSIESLVQICNKLEVSLDTLLTLDYMTFANNEKLLVDFISKIIADTLNSEIYWGRVTSNEMTQENYASLVLPLYKEVDIRDESSMSGYPEYHTELRVNTLFRDDENVFIDGDVFYLSYVKTKETLYFIKTEQSDEFLGPMNYQYELYLYDNQACILRPICSTSYQYSTAFDRLLPDLYATVVQSLRQNKITAPIKDFIDRFMDGKK